MKLGMPRVPETEKLSFAEVHLWSFVTEYDMPWNQLHPVQFNSFLNFLAISTHNLTDALKSQII